MKRMAFANVERGMPLYEWELGSRATADMAAENQPPIILPTLRTRIGRAVEVTKQRVKGLRMAHAAQFLGCQITLLDAQDTNIYFVDSISDYKQDLKCYQIWPEPKPTVVVNTSGKQPSPPKITKWLDPEEIDQAWNWQKMKMYNGSTWISAPPWEWDW